MFNAGTMQRRSHRFDFEWPRTPIAAEFAACTAWPKAMPSPYLNRRACARGAGFRRTTGIYVPIGLVN